MNGICRLSIVPLRKEPSDASEQVSQLLYGEQVRIEEEKGNWYVVKCINDNYRGWIDKKQIALNINVENTSYIVNSRVLEINGSYIPLGSLLSKDDLKDQNIEDLLRKKKIKIRSKSLDLSQLINNAKKYINAPYLWGGRTPFGVDCSGLTQMVYQLNGISLPRDAYQQAEEGKLIHSLDLAKSGDLAFFNKGTNEKITHVGIILKTGETLQIIHASGWVQINTLNEKGILDNNGHLSHHYLLTKRIIH
ncbi:MAG: C40 family peptidase [Chitinophagales bacterium]